MRALASCLAAALAGALAPGCRHHDRATPAAGSAAPSAATASTPAPAPARPPLPEHAPPRAPAARTALVLPALSGTPPAPTAALLDRATVDRLAALAFPHFIAQVRVQSDRVLEVRQATDDFPKIAATITIGRCGSCAPMDLARWQAKKAQLEQLLAPPLRDRPDTIFELGKTDLAGAPMIYTYQAAYVMSGGEGAWSDAYALYFDDGKNQIRVVAEYKDDPPASLDAMVRLVPRADLERVAKAFMDAYTHAWARPASAAPGRPAAATPASPARPSASR